LHVYISCQEELLNGSVEDRDEGKSAVVSLEEYEELVKQKEELVDQVKELERKLEELKIKNNVRHCMLQPDYLTFRVALLFL